MTDGTGVSRVKHNLDTSKKREQVIPRLVRQKINSNILKTLPNKKYFVQPEKLYLLILVVVTFYIVCMKIAQLITKKAYRYTRNQKAKETKLCQQLKPRPYQRSNNPTVKMPGNFKVIVVYYYINEHFK